VIKKKVFILLILITTILITYLSVFFLPYVFFPRAGYVKDEDRAIKIAKMYIAIKYFYKNFDDYKIEVDFEDGKWIVWYYITDENGHAFEGGGGPEVWINQSNGRITKCFLQL